MKERGKLIVIEGTDCSGKETQSNLLLEGLLNEGIRIQKFSFPNYQSPTGKIIGGSYLGKSSMGEGVFEEGAPNVDPKVSSLYYAADRKYNIYKINFLLENGIHVILDRYTYSNMAHQGGKISDSNQRKEMYQWLEQLEFGLLELPRPDIAIFLYVPLELSYQLRQERKQSEDLDQNEKSEDHLKQALHAYLELCELYQFYKIDCSEGNRLKSIEEIQREIYQYVKKMICR